MSARVFVTSNERHYVVEVTRNGELLARRNFFAGTANNVLRAVNETVGKPVQLALTA